MAIIDNLVSYWKLEEASGTREDIHGTNDLTDNNTVTSNTGKIDTAGQFTRANLEYLSIADTASLSITSSLSINAWIYKDTMVPTSQTYAIVTKWQYDGATNIASYRLIINNNDSADDESLTFGKSTTGSDLQTLLVDLDTGFGGELAIQTWYMITGVFDDSANTLELFVNATSIGSTSAAGGIADNGTEFEIGSDYETRTNDPGRHFNGRIDEVGIWSKALSGAEITSLYNAGAGLAYPFTTTSIKTIDGLAKASVSTVDGLANASVKTWNGLA